MIGLGCVFGRFAEERDLANQKIGEDEAKDDDGRDPFLFDEELFCGGAVARGEKTFGEEKDAAADEGADDEGGEGNLIYALRENEGFKGNGKGSDGGEEDAGHRIFLNEAMNAAGIAITLAEVGFPTLARKPVNPDAAGERAESGHGGVVGSAERVAIAETHEDEVGDERKRDERGVEERSKEKADAAERGHREQQPVFQLSPTQPSLRARD